MIVHLWACGDPVLDSDPTKETDPTDSADTDSGSDTDSGTDSDTDSGTIPVDTSIDTACADSCDDGLDCTVDGCDDLGRCVHAAADLCAWPASVPPDVTALASLDEDFDISLSGATWDPVSRALWVIRGNGAVAWRLVEDGDSWAVDQRWDIGNIDIESVVIADPAGAPETLHLMVELEEVVTAYDLSTDEATEIRTWNTSVHLETSGSAGSEGMSFVPDEALEEWGFTDGDGQPRSSRLGYGGLFFVGTQNGGAIHVFDLSATDETVEEVGVYQTSRDDTSALEFDPGSGRLYVWHGSEHNDLEVVRLSSVAVDGGRSFVTEAIFDHPEDDNLEGFALQGVEDCVDGVRKLFFTIDDGYERALDVYEDWPLCGP